MNVIFFWIKVIFSRIPKFIKKYPVMVVFFFFVLFALPFANINKIIINKEKHEIIMLIAALITIINSCKNTSVLSRLIFYSKGNKTNRNIINTIFIKNAIFNCSHIILYYVFFISKRILFDFNDDIQMHSYLIKTIILSNLCSLLIILINEFRIRSLSLFTEIICFSVLFVTIKLNIINFIIPLMLLGNIIALIKRPLYGQHITQKNNVRKSWICISPIIKSTIHDFFIPRFLQATIVANIILIVLLYKIIFSGNDLVAVTNYTALVALVISVGAVCFIDVPLSINWQFYSLICLNTKYHVKRAFLTLLSIYSIYIFLFILFSVKINNSSLILLTIAGILFVLLLSVGLSFMIGNIFIKVVFALFVVYMIIVYFNFNYYTLFTLVPILFIFYKVKWNFYCWGVK